MKFEKFVAEVSAMDLRLAEGSAAYTLWRSNKTGSFEEGIIPLGGVKYLVTQVDHVGGRQFRGYGSHFNLQRGSLVVGGPVRNEFVHDLTGVVGGGPTGDAVLYAARRMLQQMAKGPEMSVKDVVLPEVLLEFPAAKLQSPVESQILADQAGMLRRGRANNVVMTSLVAPVTGQVINSWQAEKQPEWTWYAIRAVSGEQRDIVLPTDGHRMFELGDLVKAGEVIFKLTTQTPQGVAEDLVWHDVQQYSKVLWGKNRTIVGQSLGCLCRYDLSYVGTNPTNWQQAIATFFFAEDGSLRHITDLDDDTAATISAIDVELKREGPDAPPTTVVKIRRHDKMAALKILAQH